ncbi:MAG: DEAD/DEAH box helicase [Actinobacteria bacterium]|nr:DEAD/DEAH box helicase [Actinomycetota bacterium]MBU1493891.1 DEAD/DEAH box helicase [Actinomycetota bacterium]MBU1865361.1 DEAD/DEAH box helicase [Actinomycetota bacterium]
MTGSLNPLIVQSDLTVLLEVASPQAPAARAALARFAELEKSPEHIHTYRITPLSLWNAASAGLSPGDVAATLTGFAKYPVPSLVLSEVHDQMSRYGRLRIVRDFDTGALALTSHEFALLEEVGRDRTVAALLGERLDGNRFALRLGDRGAVKQALIHLGWPASDEAGYTDGEALDIELTCELRGYQGEAVAAWWADGTALGGNGVLVLPCGAGKTVIGISALSHVRAHTLIIVTSISAARQWITELLDKSDLDPGLVGEYSGESKQIRPITVATYQILTWAGSDTAEEADVFLRHPHLALFDQHQWGLVVYDEVHLLPAPVFRATARIQAIRRLGLTATLVREDGKQADVFSLIGPKRFDAPWRELEAQGWIAPASCTEVRVAMAAERRMDYAVSSPAERYRIAATAPEKLAVAERLCDRHPDEQILVIGQYLDQLRQFAQRVGAPIITGQTAQRIRDERFAAFRRGEIHTLVVSKVANFAIDLPEASVAIQLSGTFGSRQEEAQRLGRLLRPKMDGRQAHFYTIVTGETVDQRFAANRQRFLTEQGYGYAIVDADEV